jgi:transposase
MLPPVPTRRRLQRVHDFEANTRLRYQLSTLHERRCRHPRKTRFRLAGSAFAGRASNPLGRSERFQATSVLLSRAYPDASWAHGRRKFFDLARLNKAPIAAAAVARIDAVFAIEREINGATPQERVRIRHERSRPLIIELQTWLREQRTRISKHSETGKAIDYSLKRWAAFTRFLDDGRLCMSNNAAERELRAVAMLESLCIPSSSVCKHWNRVVVSDATRATFSGHRRFDRFRCQVVGANLVWRAGHNLHCGQHAGFDQAAYCVACGA